jgi:hypothetical protein
LAPASVRVVSKRTGRPEGSETASVSDDGERGAAADEAARAGLVDRGLGRVDEADLGAVEAEVEPGLGRDRVRRGGEAQGQRRDERERAEGSHGGGRYP